jgi:L-rhamnose isomerase
MSEMNFELPVDSPDLDVNEGKVWSPKQFSDGLTLDLTDDEIKRMFEIVVTVSRKWRAVFITKVQHPGFNVEKAMKLIDDFEDELITRLAESMDLIATVDASPVFSGEPPVVDIVGALDSHYSAKFGMDHERKEWEVKRAAQQGTAFLGSDRLNID